MTDKGSAFLFDVAAYRASRSVQRMTYSQRGMYVDMLAEQWDKGSLPDDPRACAELLGGIPEPGRTIEEEWIANWPVLRRNFVDRRSKARPDDPQAHDPTDHNRARQIINLRLERTRRERRAYLKRQQELGRRGGHAKAQREKELRARPAIGPLQGRHSGRQGEPIALEGNGRERNGKEGKRGDPDRGRGLAYDGPILTVFQWQFSELGKALAAQKRESFDLLRWFPAIEADIQRTGIVLPLHQQDRWRWLLDRLYDDAGLERPNLMGRGKLTVALEKASQW
jgi:hypothetical protein